MTARTLRYLIEIVLFLWTSFLFRGVLAATAIATITVTITSPTEYNHGLALSSMQLDMRGKASEELTITNLSSEWREVMVELLPASAVGTECSIRHAPVTSSIPPGGVQVIRLMMQADEINPCLMDYRMKISDLHMPAGAPMFSVPVLSSQKLN